MSKQFKELSRSNVVFHTDGEVLLVCELCRDKKCLNALFMRISNETCFCEQVMRSETKALVGIVNDAKQTLQNE